METLRQQQAEIYRLVDRLRVSARRSDPLIGEPNDPPHPAKPNDRDSNSSADADGSIETRARRLIRSDKFRSEVGYAILDENWDAMFPEAIQAKAVGVVTRSLFESGANDELINDTHLMTWVVFLMTSPDNTVQQP